MLGLEQFENDEDVIKEAAIDANEKLLAWQISEYHRECDHLMDEVVKARAVLLDAKRKTKYDERLRKRLGIEELPDVSEDPNNEIALATLLPLPPKVRGRRRKMGKRTGHPTDKVEAGATRVPILDYYTYRDQLRRERSHHESWWRRELPEPAGCVDGAAFWFLVVCIMLSSVVVALTYLLGN